MLRRLKGYPKKPQNLGHHLRLKRLEKGLLQQDLAKMFQVNKQTISNWEQGYTQPPLRKLKIISIFLGYCYFERPATTIALRIKHTRSYLLGMDIYTFAKYTGIDPSSIMAWERGEHRPSKISCEKMSSVCGVNFE